MKKIYLLLLTAQVIIIPALAQELRPPQPIATKTGQLLKLRNLIDEKQGSVSLQRAKFNSKQYLLIQFDRTPGLAERQAMDREGIKLFDYLPGNAFMAEVSSDLAPSTLKKYKASGVFDLEPQQKISPKLNVPVTGANKYVAVSFFGDISRATVITELKKAGAQIAETKIQPATTLFVHATPEIIQKIAMLPFVSYISAQTINDQMLNNTNRGIHGAQALAVPTGRNLNGKGITIGVGDNGDPTTHTDFSGRVINRNPLPPANHGTHVTGTTGGAGLLNEKYKGLAPKATLISQASSDILVHTPAYMNDFGMVLTNNSYYSGEDECPGNGDYDILSNYVDVQLKTFPDIMHIFAGGNDGYITCTPYAMGFNNIKSGFQCAKNVLTVGGLDNGVFNVDWATSRGPTNDGRLKPEICAGSASVNSTRMSNNYGPSWGSSMAAPAATGALGLLYERYRQLHGGANPKGALMKAIVVNGSDDMGTFGPDFTFGFGKLNARNAVEILENNTYFTGTVGNGGTVNFNITGVPAGTQQLKVLLYWADVPASPSAPTALVNNLNLTVTEPGGLIVHNPLILNPAAPNVTNAAFEGVDNVNNIEQVIINLPPAGDFTVTITGANIPSGTQEFYVAYQLINPGIIVEHPYGGEKWVPADFEFIHWNSYGGDNIEPFTIEYSIDGGTSWLPVATVPATARTYWWQLPNTPSANALVRVTKNDVGSDVSNYPFAIIAQPPSFANNNACRGYNYLTWDPVPSATSYEILMLRGDEMMVTGTTTSNNYLLGGLWKDSTYWVTVRALIGTTPGRWAFSRQVVANSGPCTMVQFDNDFTIDSLVGPLTGRMNTSTQLGVGPIRVQLRNLDNANSTGGWDISYQVNNGGIFTESSLASINAATAITYSFGSNVDFSAPGTYELKIWVDHIGDTQKANDTLVRVIKNLVNDPITLSPSFTEGFESAAAATYDYRIRGLTGLDRADFGTNNANGRLRTYVNTGFARTGNRAATLDQKRFTGTPTTDSITTTFNLSGYTPSDQLWLDFYYLNHGVDFPAPNNRVWIRGSDLGAWVPVFNLPTNDPTHFGVYRASTPINIKEALANAAPPQVISSSFQVRFGQQGFTSANNIVSNGNLDDGFTFDDIRITNALNDVGVQAVVSPNLTSICGLSATETIEVRVKNYSTVIMNNVAVSYRVNGVTVNEVIATLNPGQVYVHTFAQTANLAAFQEYSLDAWVNYPTDNYSNNDSLLNIVFHTTPTITTYPYLEGFEANNGYWYTGGIVSSWQWNTPAKTIINKAANGTKAWVTSATGNHNNGEFSYLYSPCFNLSGLSLPVFSFSHIFRMEDDCDCDFHWVEYSLDDVTWTKLGSTSGGTNWYDHAIEQAWQASNTRWHVSSYDIPVNPAKIRFRFVLHADPAVTYEGVGIDDVHIFDKAAIYTGADITSGLTQTVSGNNWIHFNNIAGHRIASINPNGQNLGNTEVKVYFNNTGSDRYSNVQYYLDRNIVIQPTTPPAGNVSVRFYFTEAELINLIDATGCSYCTAITDAYAAGVTQYSNAIAEENGLLGDNASGIHTFITPNNVLIVPYDNGYYAEFQVSNFSEFWINSGGPGQDRPLPVQLGSFTATQRSSTGLLEWVTLQEANTDKFIVEKSYDGVIYQTIGEVKAAGNSTTSQRYRLTDVQLMNGINYYRLKMVDLDGKFTYSPIRLLNVTGGAPIITMFPNPVKKGILYVNTSENCRRVDITDVQGRLMKTVSSQGTRQTIPLHQLSKGTYIVTVVTDNGKKVEKIVIE